MNILRSRFFWKLYASYVALVVLTAVVIGLLVHTQVRNKLLSSIESSLKDRTSYLTAFAEELFQHNSQWQDRIIHLGQETQSRVTLIRPNGEVIADSHEAPKNLDNHADRPEIMSARQKSFGMVRRFSDTLKQPQIYAANAVYKGDRLLGFIRVSISEAQQHAVLYSMRVKVVMGAAIGAIIALLIGGYVTKLITAPINEMKGVAEAMRAGDYNRHVRTLPKDEIGYFGETFNRLGSTLNEKIRHLSREEAQLRAILSSMVEGVIAINSTDDILFCNRATTRLLGIVQADVTGKKIWQISELAQLQELVEKARTNQLPQEQELKLGSNEDHIVIRVRSISFSGIDHEGVILVLQDISQLRRLERIRKDFVANVSHEFKTPLTSIKGYVETLLDGAISDKKNRERFLTKIDDNVAQLVNQVEDLLQLSKIESAQERGFPLKATDWSKVINFVIGQQAIALKRKNLTLDPIDQNANFSVKGDDEAMVQIFGNLLSNAIKYTPAGGTIRVRTYQDEKCGYLEVSDSGIGIPKKELPRIFERFYRVDKGRSRAMGSTGLGLSIVKNLVLRLEGQIYVESEPNQGSQFTVSLPLVTA